MAQLTWRNVDAPNLSSGTDGIRTTANLLGNATQTLSQGLGQFGQAQTNLANNAAMQNALQYNDPAAYQAALSSGSILQGVDPTKVDAATMGALQNRSAALLENATNQQKLTQDQYGFGRTQDQNQNLDAARSAIGDIQRAYSSGNTALAEQLQAQHADVLNKLTPDQQVGIIRAGQGLNTNDISNNQSNFNLGKSQTEFGQQQLSYNEGRNVQAALGRINDPSNVTADDRNIAIQKELGNLSANERYSLQNSLGGNRSGGGVAGGGGASGATGIMTGGQALPQGIQTVGDMVNNKSNLLGSNPAGTATGLYQITSDTWKQFGQQALGDDWQNANIRDADVQNKVGQAIWDSVKNSPTGIAGRWASVSPADAEQMKGKSWEEVRDTISQRESGFTLAQATSDANANRRTQAGFGAETAQQNANGINAKAWDAATASADDASTVAANISNNAAYKGSTKEQVADQLQWIIDNSGAKNPDGTASGPTLNAAQAGEILKKSLVGGGGIWDKTARSIANGVGLGNPTMGDGMVFDKDRAAQIISDSVGGKTNSQAQNTLDRGQAQVLLQSAEQAQTQAAAVLQEAVRTNSIGATNFSPEQMARKQRDAAQAKSRADAARGALQTNANPYPNQWNQPGPVATQAQTQPARTIPQGERDMNAKGAALQQAQDEFMANLQKRSSIYQ